MDSKLKALKVVDLKHILATANIAVPAKATKTDLIARIQASKQALDAYAALHPPDDLLAPPEEVDWSVDQPETSPQPAAAPAPPPKPASAAPPNAPATSTTTTPAVPATANDTTTVDPELEKRRQRAARFGVPLIEHQAKKPARAVAGVKKLAAGSTPEELTVRAARFGTKKPEPKSTPAPATNGKKRPAPQAEEVDPEELERRKKRAERFGTTNKA